MEKQIFNQYDETMEETFQPKQEFDNVETIEDEPLEGELLDEQFEQAMKPQSKGWKTLLKLTALLFGVATVAQSVQWIWDSFQNRQWIYFAFSLVSLVVVLFGVKEIVGEWQRLVYLKKRENLQQQSRLFWQKSAVKNADVFAADGEQGKELCLEMAKSLKLDDQSPAIVQWQSQLNEAYSAQEVAQLFSQNVLKPFDLKAKKLISKMAAESAVVVAISPLSVVDMFFVAWRNIRLINKIADIYGIELGYFARIRLLRMVLVNIAFAGVTEVAQEIGMDWLSRDITAKLSARAAQGIGVGLLTARLGIKAMEFCRPLAFQNAEKPKLSHIQKELLMTIKDVVLNKKVKEKERV
ncbi:TIGR01620 family protein [Rodentibacter pneumotropicus]|uniref:TIGR01620 family protein n=1 Tax=Rodentibacter pneumotropicus TaxID=758 RepID=UPI00098705FA|nr:TIGR01620 family protein [Rodentibacter pneumotropicus]OOF60435.1 TIGR01620 family protein [Rodentibacter pneumotropicus]THA19165.1 TIGR01620 family protein [Rodentibacter pneumotropicus]